MSELAPSPERGLAAPAPPRVIDGLTSFAAGARFVVLRPRSWRLAIVPVLVAMVTTGLLATLTVWGALRAADAIAASLGSSWAGEAASVLLKIILGVIAVVLSAFAGLSLAQPLSGPALDDLCREHEEALGGLVRPDAPWIDSALRGLRVSLTSLAVGVPVLGALAILDLVVPIAMIVTVPMKVVVAAMLVAWDLFDYPLSQRHMGVRARVSWFRANLGATFAFGCVGAAALFVPVVGLLLLPIGVAGATHLVVRRERALPEKTPR